MTPMKRLLDEDDANRAGVTDEASRRLRELVASVAPLGERAEAKARVLARIGQARPAGWWTLPRAALALSLTGLALAGTLWWQTRARHSATPNRRALSAVPAQSPRSLATPSATPSATNQPAPTAPPAPPQPVVARPAPRRAPDKRHPAADPAETVRDHAEALQAAVLVDAIAALRRDHDPARAGLLIEYYLRRNPQGALAEEALALAIEAALARDDASARALADDYLSRYPTGRYRVLAHGALRR